MGFVNLVSQLIKGNTEMLQGQLVKDQGPFPDLSDATVTLIEAETSPFLQDHTLAAGLSGGLKGDDRLENVKMLRREE